MRICCWNVRRASAQSRVWEYFAELSPDLALLQEVSGIPIFIDAEYQSVMRPASGNRFNTAILVRGALGDEIQLTSRWDWVNRELELFRGNLVAHKVSVDGYDYRVMSVYSPAQPINPERLQGIDVEPVKLKLNPKVWGTELMWAALLDRMGDDVPWVVGGDLNASETFDYMWSGGPRGNQEILERMSNLGLVECLRHAYGKLVPTFRNTYDGRVVHQMDHLFVTSSLLSRLEVCRTGEQERVFAADAAISDHLPIVADFARSGATAV
jgi:exonuclease III